ncbi:hypothetical protein, partial [Pseudoalteromonas luteoviolacea]|uniref:hypothetical protein n=1 Tax=Pseudoalteromonas luteoviolacea TaxID=43657 RepID=UPI001E646C55
ISPCAKEACSLRSLSLAFCTIFILRENNVSVSRCAVVLSHGIHLARKECQRFAYSCQYSA